MKYFGTDGIRGKCEMVKSLAYSLGVVLGADNEIVLVGRDTRPSSFDIEKELTKGLLSKGVKVGLVGVVPTPALAYLGNKKGVTAVMITASHNPPEYNGLKVLSKDGKLGDELESALDSKLQNEIENPSNYAGSGEVEVLSGGVREYKRHVISLFEHLDLTVLGKKIYIDTAHGCFSYLAKDILESLGGDVVALNNDYDGSNVNLNCGALYIEKFAKEIPKESIGFAFDGDGDRVLAVLDGKVFDGDQMLYSIAMDYKAQGKTVKSLVGTIMTGGGVEKALAKQKIGLLRADVGDKYVFDLMKTEKLLLGGEKSGHLIIGDKGVTGDGILTALCFLESFLHGNVKKVKEYPMLNFCLETENPKEFFCDKTFREKVAKTAVKIGARGRLIVRPSGTENLVRISVEVYDKGLECEKIIKESLF